MVLLEHCFSVVCGQNPAHTWMPGGAAVTVCQRCTGLYIGAFVAFVLLWWLRPALDKKFRWAHAAFLLLMVPFGFHWVPQGAFLRTVTGFLFGAAVVAFLVLPAGERWTGNRRVFGSYVIGLGVGMVAVWVAGVFGGVWASQVLSLLSATGALCILFSGVLNLGTQTQHLWPRRWAS
jgi:uncharacterized membrane protein